jgi:hypothetical protein
LTPGKPFTRSFRICRDVLFPALPKSAPINPRGRAPDQLKSMRKNFFPLGYTEETMSKSRAKDELKGRTNTDFQGRVLRSTSSRPQSPRLLPKHGFDVRELALGASAAAAAPAAAAASGGDDAARKAAKAAKKEAKKRAAEAGDEEPPAAKKARHAADAQEEGKKKKEKKSSKH